MNTDDLILKSCETAIDPFMDTLFLALDRINNSANLLDPESPNHYLISSQEFKQTCEGVLALATAIAVMTGAAEVPPEVKDELLSLINKIVEAREEVL